MTLPDSNFLSAPLWLITTLHVLTLSLHFAAMNFVVGGVMIILFGNFPDRWQDPTVKKFIKLFPTAMAATVTLGVAPLLFLQLVYPRQVYSAAIVSGWFWMLVAPAVVVAYYSLYRAAFSDKEGAARGGWLLFLALLAVIYVSLVYSSVFSMAERPDLIQKLYAQRQTGLTWNPEAGDYLLRWLHMILGAVTVGGYFVGLLGRDNTAAALAGKRFFVGGFVLSSLAGLGYLFSLGKYLPVFMRSPGVWSLTLGILLGLGSMHLLFTRKYGISGVLLFLSLLSMVINRHYVRLIRLDGQFDPASWRVQMQWSPFFLFLVCFVVCLLLLWLMLSLFFRSRKPAA
jgi:hypothetical protein